MPQPFAERLFEVALRIRPAEQRRVGMMALYSSCAIGAVVVSRSVRDALFLAHRPISELAWMYVLASLGVAVASYGYARVADRIRRSTLNAACAVMGAIATLLMLWVVSLDEHGSAGMSWVYAVLYIFVEVLGSVIVIQFWTMCSDLFNPREAKRVFGLIGAGGTLANVIFGFAIKSFIKHGHHAQTLLYFCAILLVAVALIADAAGKLSVAAQPVSAARPRKGIRIAREGLSVLASPHLINVAAIAGLSAAAVTIIDFQFKIAAKESFSQDQLAGFFGNFYGICGGIALAVQIWLTGRVLEKYGILASLLPLPAGLALGATTGLFHPGLMATTLSKGSDTIFRYTMNDASMQLLYLPVPAQVRGRAKAFIDGILKPLSVTAAGLILLAYKKSENAGNPVPLTITGLLLVTGWIVLLVRARGEYVSSLLHTLERRHLDLEATTVGPTGEGTLQALSSALDSASSATILHALDLCRRATGRDYGPRVTKLIEHADPDVRAAALHYIADRADRRAVAQVRAHLYDDDPRAQGAAVLALCALEQDAALPEVKGFMESKSPTVRAATVVGLVRHGGLDGILAAAETLKALLVATPVSERARAADLLGQIGVRTFYRPLLAMLVDPEVEVRRKAIGAAAKLHPPELIPSLLQSMRYRETALEATVALASYGTGIESALQTVLIDPTADLPMRRGAAMVLGRLGTQDAALALVKGLSATQPEVRSKVAASLARLVRRNRQIAIDRLQVAAAITGELKGARNALVAARTLGLPTPAPNARPQARTVADLLGQALAEERDRAVERALAIVAVLVPDAGLDVVSEGLRSENTARRANAVEVLDNTVPEQWKPELLMLLEESRKGASAITSGERTRTEVLAELLAKDGWVGACAAALVGTDRLPLAPELEAALGAHTPSLREAAAVALHRVDPRRARAAIAPLYDDEVSSVRRTALALQPKAGSAASG